MTIAKNVTRLREKRGLTQQALATKMRMHRVYLAQMAGATRAPSLEMLDRLAKAPKVSLAELVE